MSQLSIALDIIVAGLLIATIVYATVLNRKLATLRNTKAEMEALVNRLVESTDQAQKGLSNLKAAAGESGQTLDERVREARSLADDLGFLVDRAGGLADRLETQIGKAREAARQAGEEAGGGGAGGETAKEPGGAAAQASGGKGKGKRGGRRDIPQKPAKSAKLRAVTDAADAAKSATEGAGAAQAASGPAAGDGQAQGAGAGAADDEPPANATLLRALRGLR